MAEALGERLWGVRLDTSEQLVDVALQDEPDPDRNRGVTALLARRVRDALDAAGHRHVRIVVSGGFDAEKIARFEAEGAPVDAYGVGSSLLRGQNDFTADVVRVDGRPLAKAGRQENPNPRLAARRLEAQHRRDATVRGELGAVAQDVDVGRLRQRALDGRLDDVVDVLGRAAVGRARRGAVGAEPAAGGAADPGRREAGLDEQGLDALLVDGRPAPRAGRWRRGPGPPAKASTSRASAASSRARRPASMRGAAARRTSSALVCSTSRSSRPARRSRRYGCRWASKSPASSLRGADEDPRGQIVLEVLEGDLGRAAQVVVGVLVDRALVVGLRPAALVVAAAQLVLDELDLLERRARTAEQPRDAAVDEQRAPALGRPMADSGSMKGASAITGSCSTGSESLRTSKRSAALEAKTARPWAPLASEAAAAELGLDALEVGAQRAARRGYSAVVVADQARRRGRAASAPRCRAPRRWRTRADRG